MNTCIRTMCSVLIVFSLATTSRADDQALVRNQYYRGITSQNSVTQVLQADINGDGRDETFVAYRQTGTSGGHQGGLMILSKAAADYKVLWHGLFEDLYPKSISADGSALTIEFVQIGPQGEKIIPRTLRRGKDFFLHTDEESPLYGVRVTASSTLNKNTAPANVYDGRFDTGWAEGSEGTGNDERLTIEFRKPVNLGLIGVLPGNYKSKRDWMNNNRLNRAEVTVEISSDRYDGESSVNFGKDLGLDVYGDRVDLTFTNKPVMQYFTIGKRSVTSIGLKITSVLLGEKYDDTFIAEIDLTELIPAARLIGGKDAIRLENAARAISDQKADVDTQKPAPVYDENF